MSHPARQAVSVFLITAFALSGCSDDTPTAVEAGQTLKAHITEVLKQVDARDVIVTDPGGRDIPCGEGRAKRTYGASGTDPSEQDPKISNTIMLGVLDDIAPYQIIEERGPSYVKAANQTLRTILVLESSKRGHYVLTGETQCLPSR